MDETELYKKQGKGERAKALLDNELLQETFKYLTDEFIAAWKITSVKDTEARERLWQAVNIVNIIRDQLHKYVNDGKIASKDLAKIKYLKP